MKAIFLCAAGLLFAAAASAQQYKWVDPDGRVRYGDQPPPGAKATPLRPPAGPPAAPAAAAKGAKDKPSPEAGFRQRQVDTEKQAEAEGKAKQEAEMRKENCAAAQANLRMFESGDRISQTDSQGERYYLDDDQRTRGAAQARQQTRQLCN